MKTVKAKPPRAVKAQKGTPGRLPDGTVVMERLAGQERYADEIERYLAEIKRADQMGELIRIVVDDYKEELEDFLPYKTYFL